MGKRYCEKGAHGAGSGNTDTPGWTSGKVVGLLSRRSVGSNPTPGTKGEDAKAAGGVERRHGFGSFNSNIPIERRRERDTRKDKRRNPTPEEYALFTDEEKKALEIKRERFRERSAPYRWEPGVSGNPSGRPKTPEGAKAEMKDAAFAAVLELIRIAKDKKNKKQLQAIEDLLDRVYGKPNQPIDVDGEAVHIVMSKEFEELAK